MARPVIATWWKIKDWPLGLEAVQVVAFTNKTVTFMEKQWTLTAPDKFAERRQLRDDIFPTFAEAKSVAVSRSESRVAAAKDELHRRQTALGQWKSIQEGAEVA
jgi:hypothetical protein